MARTSAGDSLTAQHRRAQIQLAARMHLDWLRLWSIWDEDDPATFRQLVDVTVTLLVVGYGMSRTLAASYYRAFRFAEGVGGRFEPVLARDLDRARAAGTLYKVGLEMHRDAIRSGRGVADAREQSLIRMSGSVDRLVLEGGRETVVESVKADPEARGWARIAGPNACAFCALLASRGPVYETAQTASFEAHGACRCGVEPAFSDYKWNAQSREYRELYNRAITEARASGELRRGTSNDSLNAFRRLLNRQ